MSDRNWEAELAKIDKQLASISDEQLMATSAPPAAPAGKGASAPRALPSPKAGGGSAPAPAVAAGARTRPWVSWTKVLVAVAAAAGLMYWPWPAQCGAPLIGFTAATGGVALLGVWSAIGTWRHRLGLAHLASLLVIVWGLVLGAREVLPRTGYAVPTAERGATWSCPAGVVAPVTATPPKFPG
jgi:hypothetical protein